MTRRLVASLTLWRVQRHEAPHLASHCCLQQTLTLVLSLSSSTRTHAHTHTVRVRVCVKLSESGRAEVKWMDWSVRQWREVELLPVSYVLPSA